MRRRDVLRDVTTLILDGLSVTAELVHDIISDPAYSVRILSLRGVRNLNEPKLRAVLQMAVRPSRPEGTPRLQGLYIFGAKDTLPLPASPVTTKGNSLSSGLNQRSHRALAAALDEVADECQWYDQKGLVLPREVPEEWASTVLACAGVISFDAVLCRGPRHLNSPVYGTINMSAHSPPPPYVPSKWAIATHTVSGCAGCGTAPEGWTVWGDSVGTDAEDSSCRFPLLAPPPVHSSNIKAAQRPTGASTNSRTNQAGNSNSKPRRFIARCMECIRDRYCWACCKWWCEKCYALGQMDSHDGLYYKVRDRLCIRCGPGHDSSDDDDPNTNTPADESTEALAG